MRFNNWVTLNTEQSTNHVADLIHVREHGIEQWGRYGPFGPRFTHETPTRFYVEGE